VLAHITPALFSKDFFFHAAPFQKSPINSS